MSPADELAERLRSLADGMPAGDSAALVARAYADGLAALGRGEEPPPALAALDPAGLLPGLPPSPVVRALDVATEVMVFTPVLWTWYHVYEAASAYPRYRADPDRPAGSTFLSDWLDGFGGEATRLGRVAAWVAVFVGVIVCLVVLRSIVQAVRRRRHTRRLADVEAVAGRARLLLAAHRPTGADGALSALVDSVGLVGTRARAIGNDLGGLHAAGAQISEAVAGLAAHGGEVADAARQSALSVESLAGLTRAIAEGQHAARGSLDAVAAAATTLSAASASATGEAAVLERRMGELLALVEVAARHQGDLARSLDDTTARLSSTLRALVAEADTLRSMAFDIGEIRRFHQGEKGAASPSPSPS